MFSNLFESFIRALLITSFVFMMMVIIEYLNILLKGRLNARAFSSAWSKSALGGFLGATPGCLGAYANVTLYEHGVLSFGALVAGMIATSGDESFVMMSLFPGKFIILTAILFAVGIVTGLILDKLFSGRMFKGEPCCYDLVVHDQPDGMPLNKPFEQLVSNLSGANLSRWAILVGVLTYAVLVGSGTIGSDEGLWLRVVLMAASAVCVWITLFGTDHFLREHVWGHIIRKHLPRIFLWTLGALFVISVASQYIDISSFVKDNKYLMLVAACLIGIIPESGPHLIFVTLFADGALPFSILLASSIVQDGHGMLPLLAFSRKDFFSVKAVNVVVGFIIGLIALSIGF